MESHRFDTVAKSVARPPSRRQLLRLFGGGGLAVALATASGASSQAQGTPCIFTFTGTVRVGPSSTEPITSGGQPGVLQGQLTFTADQQGGISQGQIALTGGPTVPIVGQVTGRAINLRMTVNQQLVVVAVGTAAQDLTTCQGAVDGLLTGPQIGDLGDWHATASSASNGAAQTPGAGATMAASGGVIQTGASGSSAQATMTPAATQATGTTTAGATTTAQPTAPSTLQTAVSCPECQTALSRGTSSTPGCHPVADGAICSSGLCCGGTCVNQSTDTNNCGACHTACSAGQNCCNGTCVDESSDPNNCGGCGNVCPAEHPQCMSGACGCAPGLVLCGSRCIDTSSDLLNCGGCGIKCQSGKECINRTCKQT